MSLEERRVFHDKRMRRLAPKGEERNQDDDNEQRNRKEDNKKNRRRGRVEGANKLPADVWYGLIIIMIITIIIIIIINK